MEYSETTPLVTAANPSVSRPDHVSTDAASIQCDGRYESLDVSNRTDGNLEEHGADTERETDGRCSHTHADDQLLIGRSEPLKEEDISKKTTDHHFDSKKEDDWRGGDILRQFPPPPIAYKLGHLVLDGRLNTECLMHLLKGMLGTGILAMPVGFKNGGLWVGFVFILLIGVICTHCMHLLVRGGNELCQITGANHLEYSAVMEKAFDTKGGRMQRRSKLAKNVVNSFLIFTQFGFCCVYTVFVAQNVQQVVDHLHPHALSDVIFIILVSVALVPYVMVKSLKALAPFSTVANILNMVGLVIVFTDLFQDLPNTNTRPALGDISTLPLFFGQAMFAFEGIGLILPLHDKMKQRSAFLGKFGVLNFGLTTTVCLYTAMGFYGYLKYGDATMGSITLNLPTDNWLYLSAKLMFSVSLFITYGIQFYVPINIVWPFIDRHVSSRGYDIPWYCEYLFRLFVVCVTCGLSALVPHLDLLISLVGACASSFLALIFPAMIEMIVFPASPNRWVKDIFIILLGVTGCVAGTYSSLLAIIQTF